MIPIALTTSVLVSYYLFIYDLTSLLLPLTFALNRATAPLRGKGSRLLSAACILVFLAPACLVLWTSYFYLVSLPVFFFLFMLVRSAKNEYSAAAAYS
jgi:hypothetical protein